MTLGTHAELVYNIAAQGSPTVRGLSKAKIYNTAVCLVF